jgi:hypothetical protein
MKRLSISLAAALSLVVAAAEPAGTSRVKVLNYDNCIELSNASTRVVLGHQRGGRVLIYELQGQNALYLDPEEGEWTPGSTGRFPVSAGRFDIGPEKIIPRRTELWEGPWNAEIVGPRHARLTSVEHASTGTQLVREFKLEDSGSHLSCTQIIRNISEKTTEWCHWSRTFARGQGICIIPLSAPSRFPKNYVMYEPGNLINIAPSDPNIRTRDGFLEILGTPKYPKLGMDSYMGWFGYQMRNNLLFLKKYATFPDRVYNEAAGLTISIWYPDGPMCELEPIGPRQRLAPGEAASFTEHWWLLPHEYPKEGTNLDLKEVKELAERQFQQ